MDVQESALRGASERYATLAETSAVLSKDREIAVQAANTALEELAKAKATAASAHDTLTALSSKLESTRDGFQGVLGKGALMSSDVMCHCIVL
jgi:hypothetical protein